MYLLLYIMIALQEELKELSRAETESKVAKFLSTEKSIVSKPGNPFTGDTRTGEWV